MEISCGVFYEEEPLQGCLVPLSNLPQSAVLILNCVRIMKENGERRKKLPAAGVLIVEDVAKRLAFQEVLGLSFFCMLDAGSPVICMVDEKRDAFQASL